MQKDYLDFTKVGNGPGCEVLTKRLSDNKYVQISFRVNGILKQFPAKVKSLGYINGVIWEVHFQVFLFKCNTPKVKHENEYIDWSGKYDTHARLGIRSQ